MKQETPHQQVSEAISVGWMEGGSFFGSIITGTLFGYFADKWLGTDPWLVVSGIILGTYSGGMRVWIYAKKALP